MLRSETLRSFSTRARGGIILALVAVVVCAPQAAAGTSITGTGSTGTGSTSGPVNVSWQQDLAASVSRVNLTTSAGQVRVADSRSHPAAQPDTSGYGMEIFPPRTLSEPVERVSTTVTDTAPAGSRIAIDVRGETAGGRWTEWTPSTSTVPAVLARPVSVVQVRLTMRDNAAGRSPVISALRLTATSSGDVPSGTVLRPAVTAVSYRVFATREGLVGGTTANGHVIQPSDHFVALPSGTALSPEGSDQYSVQVCGPSQCVTAPVWDIGPWNTKDNYWDPASQRQEFQDLPQGTPEAQAAYLNGYNNGQDEFGRTVSNPAGIDLADGTFYQVGLNDNGYVTVTYLFTQ